MRIYTDWTTFRTKKYFWEIMTKNLEINLFLISITLSLPLNVKKESILDFNERWLKVDLAFKAAFKKLEKKKKAMDSAEKKAPKKVVKKKNAN
jgi:hypothetical protein